MKYIVFPKRQGYTIVDIYHPSVRPGFPVDFWMPSTDWQVGVTGKPFRLIRLLYVEKYVRDVAGGVVVHG